MHFNISRRLPLSMFFGMAVAGVGVAAPVDQHAGSDDTLVLIAESALHGVAAPVMVPVSDATLPALAQASMPWSDPHLVEASQASQTRDGSETGAGVSDAADDNAARRSDALQTWAAVPAHQLDDMRGGFDTSMNLMLSFGIERAVYLNGALVTTTSFNLPAFGALPHDDAGGTTAPVSSVALLQNGPGNTFVQTRDPAPLAATVIQNTLNNQALQSLTTINTSSNSLQILRTNAFQSMLQEGIGHVTVPH